MKCKNYSKFLNEIKEPIAFVLGCYVTGLGVIRNLGRKGVAVFGLDSNPLQIGFFSKYCKGIECPHPTYQKKEFIDFLLEIGKNLNEKGVLIPTDDIYSLEILNNRHILEKYFHFTMAGKESSFKLINKLSFYETLEKQGIGHPKTYHPSNLDQLNEVSKIIKYPCYVKPVYSCYFKIDFKTKMFIARSNKDLVDLYKKAVSKNHDVVVQEYVPGSVRDTYFINAYINKQFESIGVCSFKRIREWPIYRGCGCLIEKTNYSGLIDILNPLIRNIKYYGVIDAEFKKDSRDNNFKLIEINARPWMQISLAAQCGLDHCYAAYLDSIGKEINFEIKDTKYTKWILASEDFKASVMEALHNELSLKDWINSIKGKKVYAFYAKDDPLPFLVLSAKTMFNLRSSEN